MVDEFAGWCVHSSALVWEWTHVLGVGCCFGAALNRKEHPHNLLVAITFIKMDTDETAMVVCTVVIIAACTLLAKQRVVWVRDWISRRQN